MLHRALRNFTFHTGTEEKPSFSVIHPEYSRPLDPASGSLLAVNYERNVLIYDNHKFCFLLLFCVTLRSGPCKMVHVDRHWDTRITELSHCRWLYEMNDIQGCFKYVDVVLQEGDFIIPAIRKTLLKEIYFVVPCSEDERRANLSECLRAGAQRASTFHGLKDLENIDSREFVLDIDLDYFLDENGGLTHSREELAALLKRDWLGVGVALSPHYCGGIGPALSFLRPLLRHADIPVRRFVIPL